MLHAVILVCAAEQSVILHLCHYFIDERIKRQ